eukprot:XP_763320.1 peptide chain release factor 1 [Theileria parva strain Muguga]
MFGICKLSLFVRDKSVLKNVYNLSGVSKLLENVKSSLFYPLKDSVSLFIEEPNESTKELVDSEILSLYHQIYPQILQHSLGENLTDMNVNLRDMNENLRDEFVNLRRKLVDMQNSLFSGSLHTLNYHKILLQVLQGVGGEESGKFAAELYDMYANICNLNNLKHIKHPNNTLEIFQGLDRFRYEFGVHRVQRVPFNSRRIQTSSAVVTVVPHFNVEDINIKSSDLMVETMRSSGSGGQSVNKSETAVRITHIPTGITTSSRTTSSQVFQYYLVSQLIILTKLIRFLGLEKLKHSVKLTS